MKLPQDLAARLSGSFGLDPNLCQGPGLEHAVRHCMEQWNLPSAEAFYEHIRRSRDAFKDFTEELLIPESWFFRDRAPFLFLKQWVQECWLPQKSNGALKVLSLPCAAGQEPYSVAITLLEAGLPAARFRVLAGDLSPRSLEQAREGRFRSMAFRGGDFCERDPYFEQEEGGLLRVRESVRQTIEFRLLNLLDPSCYQGDSPFDVIFCRNVLIYFDEKGRRDAIRGLDQALGPEGLLCVGHADALPRITDKYRRVGPPGAFCFQRTPEPVQGDSKKQRSALTKALPRKVKAKPAPVFPPTPAPRAVVPVVQDGAAPLSTLAAARAKADTGELSEAELLCQKELGLRPGSVEALYLLGEVLLAQRKHSDGEAQLRRVVYLDPGHTDALFRLALLAEQRGDTREATNWRRRATKRQPETAAR